jgi:hypothetical protein
MITHAPGWAMPSPRALERLTRWERCAHWLVPLLTAGLLGACTFLMFFAARGASVI